MAKVLGNEPWSPVITKISILGAIKIVGVLMDVKMCWLGKEKARAIEDLFAWNRKSFSSTKLSNQQPQSTQMLMESRAF
ncbi:hypothetical protein BCR33DRAFT_717141 [Rhizoclosmatium globosum]|uniref:Uncharacterized protein n=1 Tax=Rhizoclosmatium globosum TaxID=329046 RepID=A0A1Y2CAG5_9FUNG|nr:hypothetical protein BCR33DRAFT_721641 [Rhizoclosmatium globosum]ORY44021.1 hypothetical protein BCR33DRAFT_717141 [Rhizoclosmatium globosum]|eukprot:ORY37291.1 hypothetical protein BCR33DRAFT_721641 [Rhizoclosmatium globosum]